MKQIRHFLDSQKKHFAKGGRLEKLHPLFEGTDTFFFTPRSITNNSPFIRDVLDLKRMMVTVMFATLPVVLMALYNTGLQANLALQQINGSTFHGWRYTVINLLGIGINPSSIVDNIAHGALYFLPVYMLTIVTGISWEILFASVRKHEINEGFLVTSLLFALILPPNISWWQVVLGISFGVVIGKEVFGGIGMNILNPALTGRAFLYFAYPASMTGDSIWVAVDGVSKATPLAELADPAMELSVSFMDAFLGFIPGSMGETSTLACLIGAAILLITRIGSWRIIFSVFLGLIGFSLLLNLIGSDTNPMFQLSPLWHVVLGGFAFGAVFMATDPVSSAMTWQGQWIYGLLIGILTVLIRVINPAYPEGVMLAILFGNICAPIIDKIFIAQNMKRRLLRNGG